MLAVTAGELSPIITGLIYCSVIEACQQVYALSRAREWTAALSRWCEQQPAMVAFRGTCLVRRAEILQFHGAWPDAMDEACRACECSQDANWKPPGAALYHQAETHRLRGEFGRAEEAYRSASRLGYEPQPGLALLRTARTAFQQLGAAPDLARLDTFENREASTHRAQLTTRELQVLRLVAACKTNRAIATELSLSERTIDRHVGNILMKLDVPSRTGAAAYAYRYKLL